MAREQFDVNPEFTGIAIAYRNTRMIADEVLPRTDPTPTRAFKYLKFDEQDGFTVPDTRVGRKSDVNQVEFTGTSVTDEVADFALEDVIPVDELNVPGAKHDPRQRAVMLLTNLIELDREVEVSGLVFDQATYPSSRKQVLSAADKLTQPGSDVLALFGEALDIPVMRPTRMVIGQEAWTALRRHPQVVKAVHGNSGDAGWASVAQVSDLFEVQISVGQARVNRARRKVNPDDPLPLQRAWGKHIAFLYQGDMPEALGQVSFGVTVPFKTRESGSRQTSQGARGAEAIRVVESRKSVICAPSLGYFLQDVV
jgi:hypothetical protein